MKGLPNQKRPCANCPFRKDSLKGWLGAERMESILNQRRFACHKTLHNGVKNRKQCAGHMLIKGKDNEFVELAHRMGMVEEMDLSGEELIFATERELIDHHAN
tara:strand:- start:2273 stop:2581 length:309 start_codon:yes stop_codon:yes gene_type:complete